MPKKKPDPRDQWQKDAQKAVLDEFEIADRCRVIAPTGVGKTRLSVNLAISLGKTLVVSARKEVLRDFWKDFAELDPERDVLVLSSQKITDLPESVRAAPNERKRIHQWLKANAYNDRAALLFLYPSSGSIKGILDKLKRSKVNYRPFDFAVLDEGHCATGVLDPDSKRNWKQINPLVRNHSRKTVSITATERTVTIPSDNSVYSLPDEKQFGRVAYEMSFKEAVRRKLIADYEIWGMLSPPGLTPKVMREVGGMLRFKWPDIVSQTRSEHVIDDWELFERPATNHEIFAVWCTLVAINQKKRKRVLTFHNRIVDALRFNAILRELSNHPKAPVKGLTDKRVMALYSRMPLDKEDEIHERFRRPVAKTGERSLIVSSVDKLTLGVNFPEADMAAIIKTRKGEIRLPQTIGRTTRLKDDKRKALVFLPAYLDKDGADLQGEDLAPKGEGMALKAHQKAMGEMLDVLEALRTTDDRMEQAVSALQEYDITSQTIVLKDMLHPTVTIDVPPGMVRMSIREATGKMVAIEQLLPELLEAARQFPYPLNEC